MSDWKLRVLRPLPDDWYRALCFRRVHGRWPSLTDPRTFSEKVNWRILRDRREELAWTCDKVQMKVVAARTANLRVPRTFWSGPDLRELAEVELPDRWVLKPSNGSGRVVLGEGGVDAAHARELATETRGWLESFQATVQREWAYGQAGAVFLVEEFLGSEHGSAAPPDYKFFVFDGEPRLVQVDVDRFVKHRRSIYTPDWTLVPVRLGFASAGEQPRPPSLDHMLEIARALGAGFDFMRIDLYDVDGEVWFGEFSPYPGTGLERIEPASFDTEWGTLWELPRGTAQAST